MSAVRRCSVFSVLLLLLCATAARGAFDPEPLLQQAVTLLEQGEVLQSAAAYDQLYEMAEDQDLRALALVRQGDMAALFQNAPDQAVMLYDRAIQEFPGSPALENAYCNGAMLQYEAGELESARKGFAACAERFPQGARAQTARFLLQRVSDELAQSTALHPVPAPRPHKQLPVSVEEPVVRVRLDLAGQVVLETPHGGHLLLQDGGYETLPPGNHVFLARDDGLVLLGQRVGQRATLLPEGGGFFFQGQRYPGEAALSLREERVLLVNRLPLESYLWGVVPAEMPASFAPAALQAQAVASRSYALALLRGSKARDWDLLASRLSQVYKGVRSADPRIQQAVEATEGEVLVHEGRPVLSYFHSHSGGMLEDDAAVWNGDLPFYAVKKDTASNRLRRMEWQLELGYGELAEALRSEGLRVGSVSRVQVLSRTDSGRLGMVRLHGEKGSVDIKGTLLRKALGTLKMKSTLADIADVPGRARTLRITGKGFGHGVGMSQWGAQAMALEGRGYRDILAQYYPGAQVLGWW